MNNVLLYRIFAIGIVLMFLWMAYMTYERYRPITVIKSYYDVQPVLQTKVKPGELIEWKVDVYQYTEGVKVNVVRELVCEHIRVTLPETVYLTEPGRFTFERSGVTIPANTPPAKNCYITIDAIYNISPTRDISFHIETSRFEIIATNSAK